MSTNNANLFLSFSQSVFHNSKLHLSVYQFLFIHIITAYDNIINITVSVTAVIHV